MTCSMRAKKGEAKPAGYSNNRIPRRIRKGDERYALQSVTDASLMECHGHASLPHFYTYLLPRALNTNENLRSRSEPRDKRSTGSDGCYSRSRAATWMLLSTFKILRPGAIRVKRRRHTWEDQAFQWNTCVGRKKKRRNYIKIERTITYEETLMYFQNKPTGILIRERMRFFLLAII